MLRRILATVAVLALAGLAVGWFLTAPSRLPASVLAAGYRPDLINGEVMFNAGNCAGCHMSQGQAERTRLGGGLKLKSPFGTFAAPNISPDPNVGIGAWSELEFVNAVKRGVGRHGEHLYPAFPYPAYSLMKTSDVRDLFAYLKLLPAVPTANTPHDVPFPYSVRRGLGAWKLLYFHPAEFKPDPSRSAAWNRGAYLAEGPAHCAECHTVRNAFGGPELDRLYAGAPSLEPGGRFASNITPSKDGLGDWTADDVATLLSSGTDRCFNEPQGMAGVLAATQRLSAEDNAAIGEYIHRLAPKPGNGKHKSC